MSHILGLERDESSHSITTLYAVRHEPLWNDIKRVRGYAMFCTLEPLPAIEITEPTPGAARRRGCWCTVTWSTPTLIGCVQDEIYRDGVA